VLVEVVVVVGRCAYHRALIALGGRFDAVAWRAYCLAIDVQVDLRVVGREDAVGGSDNWAGSHGVCCRAVYSRCVYVYVWAVSAKGSAAGSGVSSSSADPSAASYPLPQVCRALWLFSNK
jgi:hypothetical protein